MKGELPVEKWKTLNSEAMEYQRKGDLAMTETKFMEAVKEAEKIDVCNR